MVGPCAHHDTAQLVTLGRALAWLDDGKRGKLDAEAHAALVGLAARIRAAREHARSRDVAFVPVAVAAERERLRPDTIRAQVRRGKRAKSCDPGTRQLLVELRA